MVGIRVAATALILAALARTTAGWGADGDAGKMT
jgi:hypothetical protein